MTVPEEEKEERRGNSKGKKPHHIACVVRELEGLHSSLDIPEKTGHISGAGQNLAIAQEAAAGQVPRVRAQLPRNPD